MPGRKRQPSGTPGPGHARIPDTPGPRLLRRDLSPGDEGELARLTYQAPGAVPHFAVLFEETGGDEPRRKAAAEPARCRPGPDMGRELDRRRPCDRQPGVEDGGRECVARAQQGEGVDRLGTPQGGNSPR